MLSIKQKKNKIRHILSQKRDAISKQNHLLWSTQITEHLLKHPILKKAYHIGLYSNIKSEIQTISIYKKLQQKGYKIYYPRCEKNTSLSFSLVNCLDELKSLSYSILEPLGKSIELNTLDIIIVPALGYTPLGERIGYGRGYYDNILKHFQGTTIGLAFYSQIIDTLPLENKDHPVKIVITEKGAL